MPAQRDQQLFIDKQATVIKRRHDQTGTLGQILGDDHPLLEIRHRRIGLKPPAHVDGEDRSIVRKPHPVRDAMGDLAKRHWHLQEAERGEARGLHFRLRRSQGRGLGGVDGLVVGSHDEDAPNRCDRSDRAEESREQRLLLRREERQVAVGCSFSPRHASSRAI